jgi:hypothetical protein
VTGGVAAGLTGTQPTTRRSALPRRPDGQVTRGTTAPNRLRRVDRWLLATESRLLRQAADPLVVDLGFGASPITTVELYERLRHVRPDVDVVGFEIDRERVAAAAIHARDGLSFRYGGFELPLPAGRRPIIIRAFNVLRQYDEERVAGAWRSMCERLAARGVIVEGTCDELGRIASWVTLDAAGPRSLTLAARLAALGAPATFAERLPKALIHRNVPGEPVHALLNELERAWAAAAPYGSLGLRQRWRHTLSALDERWLLDTSDGPAGSRRWRQGELTVPWQVVAPEHLATRY